MEWKKASQTENLKIHILIQLNPKTSSFDMYMRIQNELEKI